MFPAHFAIAFLIFVTQFLPITCKAFTHNQHGLHSRFRAREDSPRRISLDTLDDRFLNRNEISDQSVERRQTTGDTEPSDAEVNAAINQACTEAIAQIPDFDSESGLGGCYNIMYLNRTTGLFQADLRLYKVAAPSGAFAGIPIDNMLVNLNSNFAQFAQVTLEPNSKRDEVGRRDSSTNYSEVLEGLWEGQIQALDYSKLSEADFMALVVPDFDIRAIQPDTQDPVNSQLSVSSAAYFVTGNVVAQSQQQAISATKPSSAAAAVEKAGVFVLPGTTLGIFPIGLVVTGSWAVLFILTFGLGTVGRLKYRTLYRSRLVALGRMRSL